MSVPEYRAVKLVWTPEDSRQVAREAAMHALADRIAAPWPDDVAAQQLAQWPTPIVMPVIVP